MALALIGGSFPPAADKARLVWQTQIKTHVSGGFHSYVSRGLTAFGGAYLASKVPAVIAFMPFAFAFTWVTQAQPQSIAPSWPTATLPSLTAGAPAAAGVAWGLITNPLILACLTGTGLNVTGIGLPWGSATVLETLARAALPLGLLAVGAGLRIDALARPGLLGDWRVEIADGAVLAGILCWLIELRRLETAALVTFAALPSASTAYILARQLGGDAPLIAMIVTVETALAMVTLPVVFCGWCEDGENGVEVELLGWLWSC